MENNITKENLETEDNSKELDKTEEVENKNKTSLEDENLNNFILFLSNKIKSDNERSQLKITSKGLFIKEHFKETIVNYYIDYSKENNSNISPEKALKKLFSTESLYYLIEGKNAISGLYIQFNCKDPQKYKLPIFLGRPIDARDYIHPFDSEIRNKENIKSINIPDGAFFELKNNKFLYLFDDKSINKFAIESKLSKYFIQTYPRIYQSKRDTLFTLAKIIPKLKLVKANEYLMIPNEFKKDKTLKFLKFKSLIFILDKKQQVKYVYNFLARKKVYFLNSEIEKFKKATYKTNGYIRSTGTYVAKIKDKEKGFFITKKLLINLFLFLKPFHFKTLKIGKRYTINNLLQFIASSVKESSFVDSYKIPSFLKNKYLKERNIYYIKTTSVIWVIKNRNNLIDFYLLKQENLDNKTA